MNDCIGNVCDKFGKLSHRPFTKFSFCTSSLATTSSNQPTVHGKNNPVISTLNISLNDPQFKYLAVMSQDPTTSLHGITIQITTWMFITLKISRLTFVSRIVFTLNLPVYFPLFTLLLEQILPSWILKILGENLCYTCQKILSAGK